jgi:hypothetical protein
MAGANVEKGQLRDAEYRKIQALGYKIYHI